MTTDIENMIIQKLDKIEILIAAIFEKLNVTVTKVAVIETADEAQNKVCESRHAHDGEFTRFVYQRLAVVLIAGIVGVFSAVFGAIKLYSLLHP